MLTLLQAEPPARLRVSSSVVSFFSVCVIHNCIIIIIINNCYIAYDVLKLLKLHIAVRLMRAPCSNKKYELGLMKRATAVEAEISRFDGSTHIWRPRMENWWDRNLDRINYAWWWKFHTQVLLVSRNLGEIHSRNMRRSIWNRWKFTKRNHMEEANLRATADIMTVMAVS